MKQIHLILLLLLYAGKYLSAAGLEECIKLYSTGFSADGFITLEYKWLIPPPSTETYGYTLFQWNEAVGWQSTSTKCNKIIQVLNVYPDIEGSDALAAWMHDPEVGLGKIRVTTVPISDFNSNPDRYLTNESGQYLYDVLMFGSWDANNAKDLTPTSAIAVRNFLNSGRGVLFGHDTQFEYNPNFSSLGDKTNLDIFSKAPWSESTNIQAVNNGFLLKNPHLIPYNSVLNIPHAHTTEQYAKGVVWMKFLNTEPDVWHNGGVNNYYLTTWNNAAMIQTGHSSGQSTLDERKIIANTLWYLSQFTTDTTVEVCTATDYAAPDTPEVNRQCSVIDIISKDNGSPNRLYIKASNMVDDSDTCRSNTVEVIYKSGLKGFYILEDNKATSDPDLSSNSTTFIPADDNQLVTYKVTNLDNYIHIQAVDAFDNRSDVYHLNPVDYHIVSVSADPPEAGAITGNEVYYCNDDKAIIKAIPNKGYYFVNWTENGIEVSTDAVFSFIVTGNRSLVANFEIIDLDFDTYAVIICDRVILLNLKKLSEDGFEVTGCKWYKNGIEVTETNTIDPFSYSEGSDKFLETEPSYYSYCLITINRGIQCFSEKIIISRKKALECLDCLDCDVDKSDNLLIYPNPVSPGGSLTLEGVVKGHPVFIYNQLGACVLCTVATGEIMQLSLDFPPGIYLIRNKDKIVKILVVK